MSQPFQLLDLEAIIWGGKEKVPPYFRMTAEEKQNFEEELDGQAQKQTELTKEMIEKADREWETEPEAYDHEREYRTEEINEINSR